MRRGCEVGVVSLVVEALPSPDSLAALPRKLPVEVEGIVPLSRSSGSLTDGTLNVLLLPVELLSKSGFENGVVTRQTRAVPLHLEAPPVDPLPLEAVLPLPLPEV